MDIVLDQAKWEAGGNYKQDAFLLVHRLFNVFRSSFQQKGWVEGGLRGEGWLVVGKEEAKEDLSMPLLSLSLLVAIASEMLDLALLLALKSLEIPYFLSFLSSKPFLLTIDRLVSF